MSEAPLQQETADLAFSEADRLAALDRYDILDTEREAAFDDIAELASVIFEAPIAVVNLVADGRQWFKAEIGIGARELPLDVSICSHAILQRGVFVVPDLTADARFECNPLVKAAGGLRFYAGALLETPEGAAARHGVRPRRQAASWRCDRAAGPGTQGACLANHGAARVQALASAHT
jgi:GAF domain-containing protein